MYVYAHTNLSAFGPFLVLISLSYLWLQHVPVHTNLLESGPFLFILWLTWAYEKLLCAYVYAYQPVRIWTISCYNQLEFTQTSHRNTITSSSKLQQLPLWFKRHLMDDLPEISNYGTVWCVATIILCCFLQFIEVKVLNSKENSKYWLISLMPALWSS